MPSGLTTALTGGVTLVGSVGFVTPGGFTPPPASNLLMSTWDVCGTSGWIA
jgi:hypothetical protein